MDTCRFQAGYQYRHNTSPQINVNNEINEATKEIENLKAVTNVLKDENNEKLNLLGRVHDKELEDLKNGNIKMKHEVNSLSEILEKKNKENSKLKNSNSDMTINNEVFIKKLEEIEDQKKHCREYQFALCEKKSGYKKEALNQMSVNHIEVDKKYFVKSVNLDVEDCGIYKKKLQKSRTKKA